MRRETRRRGERPKTSRLYEGRAFGGRGAQTRLGWKIQHWGQGIPGIPVEGYWENL